MSSEVRCEELLRLVTSLQTRDAKHQQIIINKFVSIKREADIRKQFWKEIEHLQYSPNLDILLEIY